MQYPFGEANILATKTAKRIYCFGTATAVPRVAPLQIGLYIPLKQNL